MTCAPGSSAAPGRGRPHLDHAYVARPWKGPARFHTRQDLPHDSTRLHTTPHCCKNTRLSRTFDHSMHTIDPRAHHSSRVFSSTLHEEDTPARSFSPGGQ